MALHIIQTQRITMSAFDRAFDLVISSEGEYVNDRRDPGGETKYGISKRSYPQLDIPSITLEDAHKIYYRDFWLAAKCDQLPDAIAIAVFDAAVQHGITPAIKMLQQAVGVKQDGVIGPVTLNAANSLLFIDDILVNMLASRACLYAGLITFKTYGYGWMRRIFNLCLKI